MPSSPSNKPPTIIDLFAGVGGLSLGAARAGFKLQLAVEKDPITSAAHIQNFPAAQHSAEDISKLAGDDLLKLAGLGPDDLDGLIGGPPCQGFSTIGRRDVSDHRNSLFKKFFDLVRETRPRFFLAENVPGILNDAYDRVREEAIGELNEYVMLDPFFVTASDFGAPTTRKRVLFFGYRPEAFTTISREDFLPKKETARVTVDVALTGLPVTIKPEWNSDEHGWQKVSKEITGKFGERCHAMIPIGMGEQRTLETWKKERKASGCIATIHEKKTVRRFDKLSAGEIDPVSRGIRLDPNGFCPTLRAGTNADRGSYQAVRPIHPTEPRVITPREAARLQGFPDWFRFDPTKWHSFRQIGNSVSPILAEQILSRIRTKFRPEANRTSSRKRS